MNIKRYTLVAILLVAALATSCRKEPLDLVNPDRQPTSGYVQQFEMVWQGFDQGYMFWAYENIDWDSMHNALLPRFEAFDEAGNASDDDFRQAYEDMCSKLHDHHLSVQVLNPSTGHVAYVQPGDMEVVTRDYYHPNYINQQTALLSSMEGVTEYRESENNICSNWFCLFPGKTPGKKIAYLRFNRFYVTTASYYGATNLLPLNAFYGNYQLNGVTGGWAASDKVEAIIIDVRGNGGGNADELIPLVGSLTNKKTQYGYSRIKEGLGRLDYSPWTPFWLPCHSHHLDGSKPVVVLADVNSASCSEITAQIIKSFPHGTFIGERTFGATCPLLPGNHDLFYSGVFGDQWFNSCNYYVYTSNFDVVDVNYKSYEGIGITPDIECIFDLSALQAGHDNQLERALEFLRMGK